VVGGGVVGVGDGESDGEYVGLPDGAGLGLIDGRSEGLPDGVGVGNLVGNVVGSTVQEPQVYAQTDIK